MPVQFVPRTPSRSRDTRVPDVLRPGILVLQGLRTAGLLDAAEAQLPLSRRAGHGTRSIFAALVAYLLAGPTWGIRPFLQAHAGPLRRIVAPVVGLSGVASSSAICRALKGFSHGQVRAFGDWLLHSDASVRGLLDNAAVLHRDAFGEGWHILDVDPTIRAFRQRPLEEGDSMPEGERLAPGEHGFTGKKRGELRIRHIPLLHAGAGIWLAYRLVAEEGTVVPVLAELLTGGLRGLPAARTIVRGDGEFGSVGAIRTVADTGAHHLTRLSRYALLDREDVVAAFPHLIWRTVPSAGAGPVREAAELGTFTLHASGGAAGTGGSVSTRVVVTRFERTSRPDHGVLRDGYQIELFATSLPADAWPAGDLVATYFGRGVIENRFAQEDREFALDRTFSKHPPGQEWVVFIAYFLWNLMVCEGVAAASPLPVPPQQSARSTEAAGAPSIDSATSTTEPAALEAPEATSSPVDPPHEPAAQELSPPHEPEQAKVNPSESVAGELWWLVRHLLPLRSGWRLDDVAHVLRCPADKRHFVYAAYPPTTPHRAKNRVLLRGEAGACDGCPLRDGCASHKPGVYKQFAVTVPEADAMRASALLAQARAARRQSSPAPRPVPTAGARQQAPSSARSSIPNRPGPVPEPGPLLPAVPLFLPAAARATVRDLFRQSTLDVHIGRAAVRRRAAHPLVAQDASQRRHGRKTWSQRRARWAADVDVLIVATGSNKKLLHGFLSSLRLNRQP